jgi:hypothetical protein
MHCFLAPCSHSRLYPLQLQWLHQLHLQAQPLQAAVDHQLVRDQVDQVKVAVQTLTASSKNSMPMTMAKSQRTKCLSACGAAFRMRTRMATAS